MSRITWALLWGGVAVGAAGCGGGIVIDPSPGAPEDFVETYIEWGEGRSCSAAWLTSEAATRYAGPEGAPKCDPQRVPDLSRAKVVSATTSGRQAEVQVRQPPYELLLSEVNMPWSESQDYVPVWRIAEFRSPG